MKHAALAVLLLLAAPAEAATRNYTVTSFDRIRVDGPYQVTLKTGVPPYARASGGQSALDAVSIKVEGRTLIVRADTSSAWGSDPGKVSGPVTIELGTHELSSAWINGAGALDVDKVKGLSFNVSIQGSGAMRIGFADVDQFSLDSDGSGMARLGGQVGKMTASVRGTSTLDAVALRIKDAIFHADGPVTVRAVVSDTARVNAVGLASVTLDGRPSCIVRAQGSATITGCR